MTHLEQIAAWHHDKPDFVAHFTARDWDTAELVATKLGAAHQDDPPQSCDIAPTGWYCTRRKGHDGPCAAVPL